jgi:RNA polymerase sigma-70 factor, ECF subfamily
MISDAQAGEERARRFRAAVLPHIDDAYTFAHFLMRNQADAEDAVRECYLRARRHVDSFRGRAMKPWLFAILRNVCYAKLARHEASAAFANGERAAEAPLSRHPEAGKQPEAPTDSVMSGRPDRGLIRRLVVDLPTPLREAIVLRELCGMSYGEIAEVARVPIGTVVSRLAGARAMLFVAWKATDSPARPRPANPARGDVDRQVNLRVMGRPRNSASGANR